MSMVMPRAPAERCSLLCVIFVEAVQRPIFAASDFQVGARERWVFETGVKPSARALFSLHRGVANADALS